MNESETRRIVKLAYAKLAKQQRSCCSSATGAAPCPGQECYSSQELAGIPAEAQAGLGCGNPVAIASLQEGETVVDLGPGLGMDAFLAATKVGPQGRVIGVDMTAEMVTGARRIAEDNGLNNVEFRLGQIEALPLEDNTADAVISNCVINLSTDKDRVFSEAYRVLKPGGRLCISDTVTDKPLPRELQEDLNAWASCIGGALPRHEYVAAMQRAGFCDIRVTSETVFMVQKDRLGQDIEILSISITATRPCSNRVE